VYRYQDIIDTQIIIKANECHIKLNLIQQNVSAKSRMDEYSENKATYIDIQEFINCTYHTINIHVVFILHAY
jgi:hypothetical protein